MYLYLFRDFGEGNFQRKVGRFLFPTLRNRWQHTAVEPYDILIWRLKSKVLEKHHEHNLWSSERTQVSLYRRAKRLQPLLTRFQLRKFHTARIHVSNGEESSRAVNWAHMHALPPPRKVILQIQRDYWWDFRGVWIPLVLRSRIHSRKSLFRDFSFLTHPPFGSPLVGIVTPYSWIPIRISSANDNVRVLLQVYFVHDPLAVWRLDRSTQRQNDILLRSMTSLISY